MRSAAALLLAPAALVAAQPGGPWWGGAAPCAQNCLSSAWSSNGNAWPAPTAFCNGNSPAQQCLQQQCSATPAAWQSFQLISSSVCSNYASCANAGSTGIYTITANGPWGNGAGPGPGPGGRPGGPHGGPWGPSGTWGPGVYTVTGCPWSGSPWFSGNNGNGNGWNGWGPTGTGWTWYTQLSTVTTTYTSNGAIITTTGLATIAEAVSGGFTSLTTYGVGPTGVFNAGPRKTADPAVKIAGAMLGGVVAAAAML